MHARRRGGGGAGRPGRASTSSASASTTARDFAVSAPEVVLAAIAGRTSRIRLGSAVTVLSTDDPVRVFQRFSTLDAVSGGRAEVILGRGSFTESFPLFGYRPGAVRAAVRGEAELFAELLQGGARDLERHDARAAARADASIRRPRAGSCGPGSASAAARESVVRAAHYGLPLMLAIIGGEPLRFAPYVDLYQRALEQFGQRSAADRRALAGHVAAHRRAGARRVLAALRRRCTTAIGARARLAADDARAVRARGRVRTARSSSARPRRWRRRSSGRCAASALSRFDVKYSTGTLPHEQLMRASSCTAREVAPRVREELARG